MAAPVELTLRRASGADATRIAVLHVASWKAAYPGLLPQDYLDALEPGDRLGVWEEALSSSPWPVVLVAEAGVALAGFVCVGPSRDADADPAVVGELQAIYLHPDFFGRGVGDRLLEAGIAELRGAGFAEATLWALDVNARARRFYERRGWYFDGTTNLHDWKAFVATDVRYRGRLDDGATTTAPG
ncbi:MAG: GNAT family N-acetyltransferase [Acidimicrobiales bacterium]